MIRMLLATTLALATASPALGGDEAGKYAKTPPKKTLIIMGTLIGTGAALMIAGHKKYPNRPDDNPLTWTGAGVAGGTAVVIGLHYLFKHPPGAPADPSAERSTYAQAVPRRAFPRWPQRDDTSEVKGNSQSAASRDISCPESAELVKGHSMSGPPGLTRLFPQQLDRS